MACIQLACYSAAGANLNPARRSVIPAHVGLRTASVFHNETGARPSLSLSVKEAFPARRSALVVKAAASGVAAAPVAVLPVLNFEGAPAGEAELSLKTARSQTAKGLVHRAVITYMQNKRRGTASTLTRGEVRGGGKKPFKQKGTGNARQGSRRTPLRPGGGVVFGPKPCDWSIKMNKKERQLAVGTALQSSAVSMTVVEDVDDSEHFPIAKTRDFVAALRRWGVDYKKHSTLFFTAQLTPNVELSSRNIEKLKVVTPGRLNIYDVLRADKVVVTLSGLEYLNQYFGGAFNAEGQEGREMERIMFVRELLQSNGVVLEADDEEGEEEGEDGGEAEGNGETDEDDDDDDDDGGDTAADE